MIKIFVSNSGNDNNNGDFTAPLKTVEAANEKAATEINGGYTGEIAIFFREGIYRISDTIELPHQQTRVNIRYAAYENENVCFSGGLTLKGSDFKKVTDEDVDNRLQPSVKDKILCLDLNQFCGDALGQIPFTGFAQDILPSGNELFVDNVACPLASFPKCEKRIRIKKEDIVNKGYDRDIYQSGINPYEEYETPEENLPIIRYDFPEGDKWQKAKDAFISYMISFIDCNIPLEIDTKKHLLKFRKIGLSAVSAHNYTSSYRVFNLLEELTTPGEYYIDRQRRLVFYYPTSTFSDDSKVQISYMTEPMVAIEDCKNIAFENITFENTRGMAVYLQASEEITFRDCVFRNIGMVAASFGLGCKQIKRLVHNATLIPESRVVGGLKAHMWDNPMFNRDAGKNNLIINCKAYNLGCGGFIIDGGDRSSLTPGNTHVIGCDIHDFNRIDRTYRPGVRIFGVGNGVSFCKIYNAPQQAIEIMGNDHTIAYNEIYNCCRDSYDNGAIYIGSSEFSRNSFNTRIICNYFHGNGSSENEYLDVHGARSETYDLYLDGHPGTYIYKNIFADSFVSEGTFINCNALYDTACNNVYINENAFMHHTQEEQDISYDPFESFGFSEENKKIWKERYPLIESFKDMMAVPYAGHKIIRNIHIGRGHMLRGNCNVCQYSDNFHFDQAPKAVWDKYLFDESSEVFKICPEFENIPVKYIANYDLYKTEKGCVTDEFDIFGQDSGR